MANGGVKNVVLVSHASCGKTSIAETLLYISQAVNRLGSVDQETSISDYHSDEKERKISINASILHTNYKNKKINILDAPGYTDFIGEVIGCVQVADSAVLCVCGVQGIEVGTERMWRILEEKSKPTIIFINKLDKENSDFFRVFDSIQTSFGKACLAIQYPQKENASFKGAINFLNKEELESLSGEDKQKASKMRQTFIESVIETDDTLCEKYLNGQEVSRDEIKSALKKAVMARKIIPVLCGSTTKNISIDFLLDMIVDYLPSSEELSSIEAESLGSEKERVIVQRKKDAPFSALAFKTISDPYVGQLTVFRVYSGNLLSDTSFYNTNKEVSEKIGKLFYLVGKEQKQVNKVEEGDIVAVAKLKNTETSDTLCDVKNQIIFEPIKFPEPVISFSITPESRSDEEKISEALNKLSSEDSTFNIRRDPQTKELIISGMGNLHLDIMVKRLKTNYGVKVTVGTPKVAYKETITSRAKAHGKYKKQSGGRGQYGDTWIEVEPLPRDKGSKFIDKITGGAIPKNYIPAVEKGIRQTMKEGVLTGNPLIDVKVTLYDGSYHTVDSSDIAFQIAGAIALRKAVLEANPVLLEPIMEVDITVPGDYTGQISGDLSSRRGRIIGMESRTGMETVKAQVPLAEMFKYASELRSMTQGKGLYSMKFGHYEQVPGKIAQSIIEKYKKEKEQQREEK